MRRAVDSPRVAVTMSTAGVERLGSTMTVLDPASVLDTGGLAALPGLEVVAGQLEPLMITVLRAEQARRKAGIAISRPAWKNLVSPAAPAPASPAPPPPRTPRRSSARRSRSPATW